jgi:PPP family 3-phenylpropionic acid transporter
MNKKTVSIASIYYSITFMAGASFTSYIGLYYSEIGLNNAQIGIVSAIMAFITLISQPVIGTISDKSSIKNRILKIVILLAAAATWLIPMAKNNFLLITMAIAMFSFFHSTISPLSDAITLELAHKEGFKFSTVRMAGSLGYAIMAAVAGKIFSMNIFYMFPLLFAFRMIAYILSFFLPNVKGYKNTKNQRRFAELFKDKKLVLIYTYIFILSCTFGFFGSFHSIYSKQMGISISVIGIGVSIGSFSQFPFMAAFDRIYKKFGLTKVLMFSGCMYAIRWLLYATMLTPYTLIFLWVLHGTNYIIVYLCLTEYVNTSVPKELRTRGQMMNAIVLSGLSSIIGGYFGGMISTYVGLNSIFMASAVICFIAVWGFYAVSKVMNLENKSETKIAA